MDGKMYRIWLTEGARTELKRHNYGNYVVVLYSGKHISVGFGDFMENGDDVIEDSDFKILIRGDGKREELDNMFIHYSNNPGEWTAFYKE